MISCMFLRCIPRVLNRLACVFDLRGSRMRARTDGKQRTTCLEYATIWRISTGGEIVARANRGHRGSSARVQVLRVRVDA